MQEPVKPPNPRRIRRFLRWTGIVFFSLILLLIVAYWLLPINQYAKEQLEKWLAKQGIDASFSIESLSARKAEIHKITVGKNEAVSIESATLSYTVPELVHGRRLGRIAAEGLTIRLLQTDKGFTLEGLEALLERKPEDKPKPFSLPPLPFEEIEIKNGQILIVPLKGDPTVIPFNAALNNQYEGKITIPEINLPQKDGGKIRLADIALISSRIETGLKLIPSIGGMEHVPAAKDKAMFTALHATGELLLDTDKKILSGNLAIKDIREVWTLNAQGTYDIDNAAWDATFDQPEVKFETGILQPDQLFPILQGTMVQTNGTVAFSGAMSKKTGEKDAVSHGTLALGNLGTTAHGIQIQGLDGTVKFSSLFPPSTDGQQQVSVKEVVAGLPLQEGVIPFTLKKDGVFTLAPTSWNWAGGKLHSGKASTNIYNFSLPDMTLSAEHLALERLLANLLEKGLSATGSLSGKLPLTFKDGKPYIQDGRLNAESSGIIKYVPGSESGLQKGGNMQTDLLLGAIENFHYEGLSMDIRNKDAETMEVLLHVEGRNPDLYGGQAINLNINLTGNLLEIAKSSLDVYTLPEQIEKKLSK